MGLKMITFQRKRRKKVQESQELCCKSGNPVAAHRLDCACVCPKKGEVETSHRTGSYSSLPLLDMAMVFIFFFLFFKVNK